MPRPPRPGRARRVLRNTLVLFGSEKSAQVLSLLAFIILTRHWDVATYGQYALIKNWVAIFATFSDLGLNALTIREVALRRSLAGFYLRNVLILRSAFSMVLVAALAALGTFLHYERLVVLGLLVMSLRLVLDCVAGGYVYLLQAHERMAAHGALVLVGSLLRLLGILAVVRYGGGLLSACLVWGFASAVVLGALAWIGGGSGWRPELGKWDWDQSRKVLGQALPLAAFWSLQTLYYRVDSVLLKTLAGNESVAYYDAAYTWLGSLLQLSALFGLSTFPSFSAARDDPKDLSRLLQRSLKLLLFLGLPATVGGALLAEPLITFFSTGKYLLAAPILSILCLSVVPFFVSNLTIIVLTIRRPGLLNPIYFGLLALNVLLNLIWIPEWGAQGAAWATVACEWAGLGVGLWTIRDALRGMGRWKFLGPLLASLTSALGMGLLIQRDPRLYWLLLGPLVYGAGLLLLGALDREDRQSLASVFGGRTSRD